MSEADVIRSPRGIGVLKVLRRALRRRLPEPLRHFIIRALVRFRAWWTGRVLSVSARSRRWATLYYLVRPSFRREFHAVAYGRYRYALASRSSADNPFTLRRNIHRLEKGLIMRPRREVFAESYIEETVECYRRQCTVRIGDGDLHWAEDVLRSYFEVSGGTPEIERARERFATAAHPGTGAPSLDVSVRFALCEPGAEKMAAAPFLRDLAGPPPVAYEDMLALARRRRSVRWFLPRPVPRELIDKALAVAAESPSACNRQPFEFRIFDDPELTRTVASIPMGTRGFADNFPAVAVVIGRQRAYFDERDRHVIYVDASLAVMAFILALETLGVASCCINWPDLEPQETRMARLLELEPDERPVMLVAIGYPDPQGSVPFSAKRPVDEIRRYR